MKKLFFFLLLLNFSSLSAQVRLPKLISDGMVLQRDTKLKVWGWAAPGEQVSITFSSNKQKTYKAVTNEKGEWFVMISKQKAGGPYSMEIDASNHLVINDILIGDVWLCSGQSNMEQPMSARLRYKYAEEVATANNNFIRHFLVPDKYDYNQPWKDVETGSWKSVSPANTPEFTAVGYFFAKELYAKYKIPIGLLNAATGGSPAEAWISEASLKKMPDYYNEMQRFKNADLIKEIEAKDRKSSSDWYTELNNKDKGYTENWKDIQLNDNDWEQLTVPGNSFKTYSGLPAGAVWFRKVINIPASMTGKPAKLELGTIRDTDSVFVNGKFVGNTTYQYPARRYELLPTALKEGLNTIIIRIVISGGNGGFAPGKRYELTTAKDTISLEGKWKFKTGAVMKSMPGQTSVRFKPGGLNNAMIAPLTNYAIKGAIWYQGETNSNYAGNYHQIMQTLIEDWRMAWKNDFPFLFVQLPNYMDAQPVPQLDSKWAILRQQQLQTLTVPNTGMVTAIDLGEWNDLHPENKKDIGYRLSLLARQLAYEEKKLVAMGPVYRSMKVKGNKISISFSHTGSGLVAKDNGELKTFVIAGNDGKYVPAKAVIKNNKVEVWSEEIKEPVSVMYAWADNPEDCNLYNKEGLPASPFRTDK